jgi:hypothetical protein
VTIPNNRYSAKRGSQTGSKNTRSIGAAFKKFGRTINPWGPNVPNRRVGLTNSIGQTSRSRTNSTRGSATRMPRPDPSLRGVDYPPNDPVQWPIENLPGSHTPQQDPFGLNDTIRSNINTSINHAFKRAGYPEP